MTRVTSNARWRVAASIMATLAGGCGASVSRPAAQAGVADYDRGAYDPACQQLKPLAQQTDEDYALNNVRLGSAALAAGRVDDARSAFLTAYELMNATQLDNGGRAAVAVTVDSSSRVWKGEPFERAMANYYLGLTYYVDHDYNNARGAFENALFKLHDYNPDADDDGSGKASPAAEETHAAQESNFAAAYLMLGRCHAMLGEPDAATADFTRAAHYQPSLTGTVARAASPNTNLMLFVDVGRGPTRQYAYHGRGPDGPSNPEFLGFGPVPQGQPRVAVTVAVDGVPQSPGDAAPAVDLLALAQERRWDALDTVHNIKKALEGAAVIASALTPYALIGAVLFKASDQTDTREWGMLPRTVVVLPLSLAPGHHRVVVADPTDGAPASVEVDVPAHGDAAAYVKLQPPPEPQRVLYASDAPPSDGTDPPNTWYEVRVENRSASPAVIQFDGLAGNMVVPPYGSNFLYMPAGQRQVAANLMSPNGSSYRRVGGSYAVGPQRWLVVGDDGVAMARPNPGEGISYPPRRVRSDAATPAGRAMTERMGKLGVGPRADLAAHRQGGDGKPGTAGGGDGAGRPGNRRRTREEQEQQQQAAPQPQHPSGGGGGGGKKK